MQTATRKNIVTLAWTMCLSVAIVSISGRVRTKNCLPLLGQGPDESVYQ